MFICTVITLHTYYLLATNTFQPTLTLSPSQEYCLRASGGNTRATVFALNGFIHMWGHAMFVPTLRASVVKACDAVKTPAPHVHGSTHADHYHGL